MTDRRQLGRMWTAGEVAARIGASVDGPPDRVLRGIAALDRAGPDDLSFCAGGRWASLLPSTHAGAVIVAPDAVVPEGVVALRHPRPRAAYAVAAAELVPLAWPEAGIDDRAAVHPSAVVQGATIEAFAVVGQGARIAPGAWIQAHAYVGAHAVVGARSRLMPHAVLMERCVVGERVWLQPGAVVGADGFGHVLGVDGPIRVPQLGTVLLEDDVEVGANACVDRAALGETLVGRATRLDNLVQVAHGARLGASCLLAAFAGVAGGARLGDRVVMAGRSAVVDGIVVGDDAVFAGLASASKDVPAGRKLGGSPARRYHRWLREVAALRRLPMALRTLDRLEKDLARLRSSEEPR